MLKGKVKALSLYGKQQPDEQQEVFAQLGHGIRKIIFATDVAETSITIDDVRHVVDSGLCKSTVFDPTTKLTSLRVRCNLNRRHS